MSNYKVHAQAGAIASIPIILLSEYLIQDIRSSITIGISVFLGSLAPDLDCESKPSKIVGRIIFFYLLIALLKDYSESVFESFKIDTWLFNLKLPAWCAVIFLGFKLDSHRGFTHKYIFPLIFFGIMYYTQLIWFGAFALGIIVHYVVDEIYPWKLKSLI